MMAVGYLSKPKPHAISLPLIPGERLRLRYDAQGKMVEVPVNTPSLSDESLISDASPPITAASSVPPAEAAAVAQTEPELPLIPLWFVALISLLNFILAGGIWWLNKPKPLELAVD